MRQKKFDLKELKKRFLHRKTLIPVLICAVAVLFLAFGFGSGNKETVTEAESTSVERYVADTERRLCELLSKIDGVGRCEVMITVSTSERSVYLSDTEKNGDNSSTSHIKIKTGGNEQAVAEFRYMPAVAGVAVVCEGAGSVSVRSEVAEVVSGVLGIDRTLVSVAKRK